MLGLGGNLLVSGSSSLALVLGLGGDSLVFGSSSSASMPELGGDLLVLGSSSPALLPGHIEVIRWFPDRVLRLWFLG